MNIELDNKSNLELIEQINSVLVKNDTDLINNVYIQALLYRKYDYILNKLDLAYNKKDYKEIRNVVEEYNTTLKMLLPESFNRVFSRYFTSSVNDIFKDEETKEYKTYIVKNSNNSLYKIGRTKQEVKNRIKQWEFLACANIDETIIIDKDVENELHRKFKDKRIKGEWFELSINDIEYIREKYLGYNEEDFD